MDFQHTHANYIDLSNSIGAPVGLTDNVDSRNVFSFGIMVFCRLKRIIITIEYNF